MTIVDIQRRLRELARIRIGDQAATSNGGRRPRKLEAFRITSRDESFVRAAAELYGGEPRPWAAPDGPQFEVYTTARALPVVVPPTEMAFSQAYELWSAGGCQRRCDGAHEIIGDQDCVCDPEKRACSITTRLSVILHELPGLGVCRLETHGFYAASELGGAVELVQSAFARGQLMPARLVLEQRQVKRAGKDGKPQTRNFVVPCLDFPLSFGALQAQMGTPAVGAMGGAAVVLDAPKFTPVPVAELPEAPNGTPAEQLRSGSEPRAARPKSNAAEPIRRTGLAPRGVSEGGGGGDVTAGADTVSRDPHPSPSPDDQGGALKPAQAIAMWCADASHELHPDLDAKGHDEWRHAFLAAYSQGSYSSATDVPTAPETIASLRAALVRVRRGELRLDRSVDPPVLRSDTFGWPTSDPAGEHAQQRTDAPEFSKLKVGELVALCRERGIEPEGTKAQLVALLEGREVDA